MERSAGPFWPSSVSILAQTLFCSRTLPTAGRAFLLGPSHIRQVGVGLFLDRWQFGRGHAVRKQSLVLEGCWCKCRQWAAMAKARARAKARPITAKEQLELEKVQGMAARRGTTGCAEIAPEASNSVGPTKVEGRCSRPSLEFTSSSALMQLKIAAKTATTNEKRIYAVGPMQIASSKASSQNKWWSLVAEES